MAQGKILSIGINCSRYNYTILGITTHSGRHDGLGDAVNTAALKYDALLAVSTAVWFSLSGNLMNWRLTQPGRSIAARMRSTPSPARMNPVTRRIVPPGDHVFAMTPSA